MDSPVTELFPFDSFREKQYQIIEVSIDALYNQGYSNLVLDLPTGTGKSPINTTLLRYAEDGFYTTPSKSLRQQLEDDDVLNEHYKSLKARKDYTCAITGENCEDCSINQSSDKSCAENVNTGSGAGCTYWSQKMSSMNNDISVLTFSYLIIDNMLPEEANDTPISFGDREMLVIDEGQNLDVQTASLHAGFKITPYSLPKAVFRGATDSADYDAQSYDDVKDIIDLIYNRCQDFPRSDVPQFEMEPAEKKCMNLVEKIDWMRDEIERDNHWVVDVDSDKYKGNYVKTLELRPINVSSFLKNNVWSRADKRVVSTATLPYRANPEIWLRKVGLDPEKTKVISVDMPFPKENRPIHTKDMVCSMSSNGDEENWDEIMKKLNELAKRHYNQNCLIHSSSYARAEKVLDSIDSEEHPYLHNNVIVHNNRRDADVEIEDWQASDHDIFISPSMMEGVDLKDDMCRWQVLLKVPYPSMDSRIEYIVNNTKYGWNEYFERALLRVVQSYGRAIRSKDDYAEFYVLDEDFDDLLSRRTAPSWFTEAIDIQQPNQRSVFDY